jgi:hypothetical protein
MQNVGLFTSTFTVRAAADLAAAGTAQTLWVPCRGARCVVFTWKATNGNAPQNQGVEGNNLIPLVTGGVGLSANNARLLTSSVSSVLNQLGGIRQVVVPIAAEGLQHIVVEGLRATLLGHATLTIAGLECEATVYYDSEAAYALKSPGQVESPV